jgi:hypothetical protein
VNRVAAGIDQAAKLRRGAGNLDLEIADQRNGACTKAVVGARIAALEQCVAVE